MWRKTLWGLNEEEWKQIKKWKGDDEEEGDTEKGWQKVTQEESLKEIMKNDQKEKDKDRN